MYPFFKERFVKKLVRAALFSSYLWAAFVYLYDMEYQLRTWESFDYITLIFVVTLILLAVVKYRYPRRFQEFMLLPITNKYFLIQGKNDAIFHPFNLLLFGMQILSVSLFIFFAIRIFQPQTTVEGPLLLLQIATLYAVFIAAKYCIEKIVGIIFSIEKQVNEYLYQKLSYRNMVALLLLFVNVLFVYLFVPSRGALIIIGGIMLLINCISLFSSYKNKRNFIFKNFFYFILYLCALEISPYVILYHVAVYL